jgi:hypothetical protein
MGREFYYKPGSFYRIDDRTGFTTRAEHQQFEWTGLIIDRRVWEIRQPQDYVKGVTDDQTVPYARPVVPNPPSGVNTTCSFTIYGDLPTGQSLVFFQGGILFSHPTTAVTQASYPRGN